MARLFALLALLLAASCSSDDGNKPDTGTTPDKSAGGDTGGGRGDAIVSKTEGGGVKLDGSGKKDGQPPVQPGVPGAVCTQQNKTCGAGLKCVFLETWNAPKGTCVRDVGSCSSWDDPRCVVTGTKYSVMCGPYTENTTTTHICFLLCKMNNQTYDCPPLHTCKLVNGYDVCLPQ